MCVGQPTVTMPCHSHPSATAHRSNLSAQIRLSPSFLVLIFFFGNRGHTRPVQRLTEPGDGLVTPGFKGVRSSTKQVLSSRFCTRYDLTGPLFVSWPCASSSTQFPHRHWGPPRFLPIGTRCKTAGVSIYLHLVGVKNVQSFQSREVGRTRQRSWLMHYINSRKVANSIPDEVNGFLNWPNPSNRSLALRCTQLLTEINTKNLPGGKGKQFRSIKQFL